MTAHDSAADAPLPRRISFGGDYNPEQWPEEVWHEDVRLMQQAGVDLVSVGVFSWAWLEPEEGRYEFGWLDRVLDLLHEGGIGVDLATATASPPPWLSTRYPETLPQTADGARMWPGGRQAFCPSSPVVRERGLALVEQLAKRYSSHPAVRLWHVSNELGCHNAHCYCDVSAAAFRGWLERRYGSLDALNDAWGTAFWSQRYTAWEQILPPRLAPTFPNPTQQLDFRRFSSDQLLENYLAEQELLHELSPAIPVTTNLMVMQQTKDMDYFSWGPRMDVVSNDHYLTRFGTLPVHVELAFSADLTRGVAGARPWLLMEHSTSAVNWQPVNVAKLPGEMTRNSLSHVARGADGVLFFQWRQSRAGAEKFHSALVPHGGEDTKVWREVVELGATLDRLDEVAGSTVRSDVAFLLDWNAWWGVELDSRPSSLVTYLDRAHAFYAALWERGTGVDFLPPDGDLSGYRLLVVPTLYLCDTATADRVRAYAEAGGTVVVTYFSGIVDEHDAVHLGGYPGAFRDLLGISVEEFFPLLPGESVQLDDGTTADTWTELLHLRGAEALVRYADGPLAGVPALTRAQAGSGTAYYVATRTDAQGVGALVDRLLAETGVVPVAQVPAGVEAVRRTSEDGSWLFLLNHSASEASVPAAGTELVTGRSVEGTVTVPAGGVAVVREARG
ncbi:beta-galactosidase [Motilibacter rhizosphaerae]|uniref:beta-galactosidase n=1 Tax=Motilibacter rhizosphaerae TaxID=598652 RepID=UPI001E2892F6|nr:beta-galactosidase [Motilibacter rhizosphaerae]